jgi:hypothetical protein
MDIIEYKVCQHFLPAIFNGDESGLSELDCGMLAAWLESEDLDLQYGHFSCGDVEEPSFATCDITGLKGDTVTITWVIMKEKPTAPTLGATT